MSNQHNSEALVSSPPLAHTPEPWKRAISNPAAIVGPDDIRVALAERWMGALELRDAATQNANADRICACVNAASGISTQALEEGIIKRLADSLGNVVRLWDPDCKEGEMAQQEALRVLHELGRGEVL